MWDAQTGQELLALKGHTRQINGVCFSPDGKRLASASYDSTVRLWDWANGQEVLALRVRGFTGVVMDVCFSPDGQRLASAPFNLTVQLWEAQSGSRGD